MAPGTFKPTLQLRHQLNCSGIAIDAAAYDARRHHLLTYDSHALKPHTLRLFSLRREIRSTPLFDVENKPPSAPPPLPLPTTSKAKPPRIQEPSDPIATTVVRFVALFYALELDVFVCVYSAYHDLPGHHQADALGGYSVVFLEPASLKKLVVYNGPRSHLLQCVCLDESTGRLVLASRVAIVGRQRPASNRRKRSSTVRVTSPSSADEEDRSNVVEMVEVSKRPFRRPTPVASSSSPRAASASTTAPLDRVMLCVERLSRATLWHSDHIACMAVAPRVRALFGSGAAYDDDEDEEGGDQSSVVLEWRENTEGMLTLVRRIFHERDRITALASSYSGQWLFTGHASGVLKVWDMVRSPSAKDDDHPQTFAPTGCGGGASFSHQSAVARIEQASQESKEDGVEMSMLYTTERCSGSTRHWRFRALVNAMTAGSSVQLDCLGDLDVDPVTSETRVSTKKKKRKRYGPLGEWTRTIPLCISVQMGSYTENLLVVTRGDIIHVIKIQTLVQVVHEVARGEEIFVLESIARRNRNGSVAIVCFSGTTSFHRLQISEMDPQSASVTPPHQFCLPPPMQVPSQGSIRLTRLHVGSAKRSGEACIVCGWSTGVVEVYIEQQSMTRRIALLQAPRLDVEVTALVITDCEGAAREIGEAEGGTPSEPKHSWGGLLKSAPVSSTRGNGDQRPSFLVLAGAASGAIFGWRVVHSSFSCASAILLILEASIAINRPPAHSAHVVDLVVLSSESSRLLSMGADGIIKLWALPSMRLEKHINAAASAGAAGTRFGMLCSCVQVLDGGNAIAVGYEDGAIAVWHSEGGCESGMIGDFVELPVSGRHERRVSAIATAGERRFLTASLDMTIVLWALASDTNQVEELRFFELGQPVVDCCVTGGIVLVGLGNEVCWFSFDEDTKPRTQHCLPSLQEIVSQAEMNQIDGVEADAEAVDNNGRPEENSPRLSTPRSSTLQLSPSQLDDGVISIPSVAMPGSSTMQVSFALQSHSGLSGSLEGWQTDQANDSPMDPEVLSLYVRQYIATCGATGTITAESLSHFLAMHHLPWSKRTRPDFFIRKYLHACKIDPKARLTVAEATALLHDLQRTAETDFENEMLDVKATKASNSKRRAALKRLAEPRKKTNRVQNDKPTDHKVAVVTYNILGEKSIQWVPCSPPMSNQETGIDMALVDGDAVATDKSMLSDDTYRQRRRRRKEPSSKHVTAPPALGLPDRDLLGRVHLSASFQTIWTRGFCWCLDSQWIVQWDTSDDDNKKSQVVKCSNCGHRRHTLHLQRNDYKPHFTARAILGIIAEVYEMMMEPAYHLLYRNDDTTSTSHEVSIHAALWKLFQHRFGVQHIVETKLKLLFVSMCHLVREMDAVAVFGELLALFQRADHDEQAPHKMVALCVVSHGWLYAREMVVNGDPIWGKAEASSGENGTSKATHWQFVSLPNALFCAQEILVYPLVSPGYLQNILLYMEDYAQHAATKPGQDGDPDEGCGGTRWLDIHRLLRLLVGEWKQQATEFRDVERLLFTEPLLVAQDHASQDNLFDLTTVLEKLRLMLSCFVFYDHERVGLTELCDFEDILRRLKYLWPNEHLSEEEAAGANRFQDSLTFENTILAARRRFGDTLGDGRICYLDFWAMLYIVGVRTKSLLKFREIPSFCKDYRLEVSSDLREMLAMYMQRSSALLLPRGFHTAKSSVDLSEHHQHQRRAGGLYDGVYVVNKPNVTHTLSMHELLSEKPKSATNGLYVDGAIPAMRRSSSTTALEGFSREAAGGVPRARPREHVVMGVRPTGPRPKPVGFLTVSSLGFAEPSDATREEASRSRMVKPDPREEIYQTDALPLTEPLDSYANVYIQFPNIPPRKTRVDMAGAQHSSVLSDVGSVASRDHDDEATVWQQQLREEHEHDEQERRLVHEERVRRLTLQKEHAVMLAAASTAAAAAAAHHHHNSHVSPPKENPSFSKVHAVEPPKNSVRVETTAKPAGTTSTRSEESVVVVPTIEKHTQEIPPDGESEPFPRSTTRERRRRKAEAESEPVVSDIVVQPKETLPASPREDSLQYPAGANPIVAKGMKELMSRPQSAQRVPEGVPVGVLGEIEEDAAKEDGEEEHEGQGEDEPSDEEPSDANGNNDDELESDSNDEEQETLNEPAAEKVTTEAPPNVDVLQTPVSVVPVERNIAELSDASNTPTATVVIQPVGVDPTLSRESVVVVAASNAPSDQTALTRKGLVSDDPTRHSTIAAPQYASFSSASPNKMTSPAKPPPATTLLSPPKRVSNPAPRHRFKFSQQPKFKLSAALISNPFRSKPWKPLDGSDSDDDSEFDQSDASDDDDDTIDVDDMALRLSRRSLAALRKEFGRKKSVARTAGMAALAFPSGGSSRRGRGGSHEVAGDSIDEDGSSHARRKTSMRLDEDAERALYGGRARHYLGEGIAFNADAEALMQHKWQDFFGTAEATMFSPLKDVMKQREDAQRQHDELQIRLMKKRMEQQHLDTMRLRRNTNSMASAVDQSPHEEKHDATDNFRARRQTRETCFQDHQRLCLGETASGELHETHATSYFHFEYAPDASTGGYSIITFKLHVVQGEANLFLSTQTTAPCSSDCMWRSAETSAAVPTTTAVALSDGEGQKIVLYPHDVARLCRGASTASVVFYMAVAALAPHTLFTLGVMTSGQKAAPSRAIQTVDNLIAHFNQLAKTYEGQASRRRNLAAAPTTTGPVSRPPSSSGASSVDRLRGFLASAASMDSVEGVAGDEGDGNDDTTGRRRSSQQLRRQSNIVETNADPDSLERDGASFQQLLESFGEKHHLGLDHSRSPVLSGATSEQQQFLQDEEASYRDAKARLASPVRNPNLVPNNEATHSELFPGEDDGTTMAIAVVTERRLSTSSSMALQQRLGARLKQRLSPLKASSKQGESPSLRIARFEPKLVAYSLSSLPPPKHPHHHHQQQLAPAPRTKNKR